MRVDSSCVVTYMTDSVIAIIQARMGSSRLPGKSMAKIGERTIIEYVLRRVERASRVSSVVVAISNNPKDDILEKHVQQLGYTVHRGSEDDVLERFYNAAKPFNPVAVVRITGDCPLVSCELIDLAIDRFFKDEVDYLSLIHI